MDEAVDSRHDDAGVRAAVDVMRWGGWVVDLSTDYKAQITTLIQDPAGNNFTAVTTKSS